MERTADHGLDTGVVAIAAGFSHTCAITSERKVACWGSNGWGQLGNNTVSTKDQRSPVLAKVLTPGVLAIAVGLEHSCAVNASSEILCWGRNNEGQLGYASRGESSAIPTVVSGLGSGFTAVACGTAHTCALSAGGGVVCWGSSSALGSRTSPQRRSPTQVHGLDSGVTAITAGRMHTCALMSSGGVKCWGGNNRGQIGDSTEKHAIIPESVNLPISDVVQISAGDVHTCALTSRGVAKCWGGNGSGQLGNNSKTDSTTPVSVAGFP